MKISKLVSVLSALTITASAFAGLAVTANAATGTLYSKALADWSDTDASAWTGSSTSSITAVSGTGLTIAGGNSSWSATTSFDAPNANSIITFDAVWNVGDANGNTGQYTYLNLGSGLSFRANSYDQKGYIVVGSTEYTISNACSNSNGNRTNDTWTVHAVIDTANNLVTELTVAGTNGTTPASYSFTATSDNPGLAIPSDSTYANLTAGFVKTKRATDKQVVIQSVSVSAEAQTVDTAGYTVKYVDEDGNAVKDADTSRSGVVGNSITLLSSDTADFTTTTDGTTKKWIYKSDDSTSKTIAAKGTTVVTVTFREASTYSYSVASSLGTALASGTGFEGDSITYAYPKYELSSGTLYESAKNNSEYRNSITLDENNKTATVTYTATDISDVVYYAEAEDIDGLTTTTTGNIPARSSNAKAAYATADTTIVSLQPGKYKIYGMMYANSSVGVHLKFTLGSNTISWDYTTSSNTIAMNTDEYELTEATDLVFNASGADGAGLDYIYIVKTGEATTTSKVDAAALGAYVGTDGSTATAFKVALDNSASVDVTTVEITSGGSSVLTATNGTDFTLPTLTNTEAVIGVIVNDLNDANATATVSFK